MRKTLQDQLSKRMDRSPRDVFLREDFDDLGGYDQVGRALRKLVSQGRLLRIGSGLYARARPSTLDGAPTLAKGLHAITEEALGRFGIRTGPTRLEQAYSAGRTTQVPSGRRIAVDKRVRRKIGFNAVLVSYERSGSPPR